MKSFFRILILLACLLAAVSAGAREQEKIKTLRLSFAGDCTLGGHEGWMNYSIGTFKVMAEEQKDYAYFLKLAQPLFARDDFTFVNLEVVLADSARGLNTSRKWNFRGATEYVQVLTLGSVEGVTLGNNHSHDFGKIGLKSTRDTLDGAGILWAHDEHIAVYEKDGIRLAFLGFWETDFRRLKKWLAAEIPRLKAEDGVDAVIINYHGGREYTQKRYKTQEADMRYAIDCGADLVIGHHPHTLQGMEIYKERMIVYSLGNFCYGGNRKPREVEYPTMVLGAELMFSQAGFAGTRLTIHPFNLSGSHPRNNYQPLPVTGELAQEVMDILQKDSNFPLNTFVEGQGAVQETVWVTAP